MSAQTMQMPQQTNIGRANIAVQAKHARALIAFLMCALPALAGATPQPHTKVLAAVKACEQSGRELLQRVVAIDSGTGDVAGLNAVGAIYAAELQALGATVKPVAPTPPAVGNNVVATLTGTGKGRIVLIAHMDTVFNHGDVAKRICRIGKGNTTSAQELAMTRPVALPPCAHSRR